MGNGNWISHPPIHSPIHQLDGTCDPCDKDDDSQLNDTESANSDNHSEILCAMCNFKMTPTHQCSETNKMQPKSDTQKLVAKVTLEMTKRMLGMTNLGSYDPDTKIMVFHESGNKFSMAEISKLADDDSTI